MRYRISTDIGGTFTDVVVVDSSGEINIFKSPSTPGRLMTGVINGLKLAAQYYNEDLNVLMNSCDFFSHGSTVSTNALIENKTAKVGLICTEGHRDVLLFREGGKDNPFEWYVDYPEPYVPRYLTLSVPERVTSEGAVLIELDENAVREAIQQLREFEVEVIAVSLFWSFINPVHELRIAEIIEEEWPDATYTLSHLVNPRIREYRRTVSTVIDASLKPLNTEYVSRFQEKLKSIGYHKEPYLFTASGGLVQPDDMIKQPIFSIDSGPALAPISGRFYAEQELNENNVISCDMGGTSFDIAKVSNGDIAITNNAMINNEKLSIPKVDVKTIGSGGGSIAWIDEGGLIRIGPEGASSEPGPACYMRGGERATVTDAALILGYLDADYFLGGEMELSVELAEKAIEKDIAKPLNISVMQAAFAVWNTATAKMAEAIRDVTVWEGINPTDYTFVAGGGAVGVHIIPIAKQLGAKKIIIPKTASTLSAFGGAVADVVREFQKTNLIRSNSFDFPSVNETLKGLYEEANEFLENVGIPVEERSFEYLVEARYPFQEQELSFEIPKGSFENDQDILNMLENFHEMHDKVLGSKEPGQYIECVVWKVRATGLSPGITLKPKEAFSGEDHSLKRVRQVYFDEEGKQVDTPVYDGDKLQFGHNIIGPAIIEEPTMSLVVFPNEVVEVSKYGNYIVNLNSSIEEKPEKVAVQAT